MLIDMFLVAYKCSTRNLPADCLGKEAVALNYKNNEGEGAVLTPGIYQLSRSDFLQLHPNSKRF